METLTAKLGDSLDDYTRETTNWSLIHKGDKVLFNGDICRVGVIHHTINVNSGDARLPVALEDQGGGITLYKIPSHEPVDKLTILPF